MVVVVVVVVVDGSSGREWYLKYGWNWTTK